MPFRIPILCVVICVCAHSQPPGTPGQACIELNRGVLTWMESGHLKEAEDVLTSALTPVLRATLGPACDWMILQNMAVVMSRSGRLEKSATYASRAIALLNAGRPHDDPLLLRPLHTLSSVRLQQGRLGEARGAFERMRWLSLETPLDRALFHGGAAALFQAEGKAVEAEAEYLLAIPAWENVPPGNSSNLAAGLNGLADLYITTKRYAEADRLLTRALAIYAAAADAGPADHIRVLNSQAILYANLGQWRKAEDNLRAAIALADDPSAILNPLTLEPLLSNYAQVLRANHESREARSVEARAARLRSSIPNAVVDITELAAKK